MVTIGEYIHLNKEDYYKYGITRRTPGGASTVAAYSQPDLFNRQRSQILKGIQLGNSAKANVAQAQLERDLQQIFFNSDNYKAQGDKQNAMYEQFASLMNQYIDQRFGQMNFDDSNGPVGYKMREIDTSQSFVTLGRLNVLEINQRHQRKILSSLYELEELLMQQTLKLIEKLLQKSQILYLAY